MATEARNRRNKTLELIPSFSDFETAHEAGENQVVYARIAADLDTPVSLMLKLTGAAKDAFMLESVTGGEVRGRYSIIGMKPDLIWRLRGNESALNRQARFDPDAFEPQQGDPLDNLRALIAESRIDLPEDLPRVMSVGRLDLNSEGLLLLTNDGGLKRKLELPSTGWLRRYRVRVKGNPTDALLEPLREGVVIDRELFQPMQVTIDRQQGANAWLTVGLREGKNREIRRAMENVGLSVNRLIRISYGPFQLGQLGQDFNHTYYAALLYTQI